MPERYITDLGDPIHGEFLQSEMDTIFKVFADMMERGISGDRYQIDTINEITTDDIDDFMERQNDNPTVALKILRTRPLCIKGVEEVTNLYDFASAYPLNPKNWEQKVWILECSDFAAYFFAVETDSNELTTIIGVLDEGPEVIVREFQNLSEKRNVETFENLKKRFGVNI